MKVSRTTEIAVCDLCQGNDKCFSECLGCGRDICHTCEKTRCLKVNPGVYIGNDYYYCPNCHVDKKIQDTELFRAFQQIQFLRIERKGFMEDFDKRVDAADKLVSKLMDEREEHEQSN